MEEFQEEDFAPFFALNDIIPTVEREEPQLVENRKRKELSPVASTSASKTRVVRFKKCHPEAKFPTKGTKKSVGWDFYSCEKKMIFPLGRAVIDTGIQIRLIPDGYFLKLESRSGLSVNHGVLTQAGIIDPDFTDNIKVVLFNFDSKPFEVNIGDKISQGIFYKTLGEEKVQSVGIVSTERNKKGFGSTGNK